MLSFFRRVSKSKIGTWVMVGVLVAILGGFAMADISNFGSGKIGFGLGDPALVKVGSEEVTDRDITETMQRRLQQVRQERPDANFATIMGDFDGILSEFVDSKTIIAFADKFGFPLSKRLVDAEIAQIPQTKGLNGQFDERAYRAFLAQQRLTDGDVRDVLAGGLLQRLMLTPVAANARASVGMATPYASMLLESREGEAALFPTSSFVAGLNPTDRDLEVFYAANRGRYMVPEQRTIRIARIGSDQVAGATATDQDIATYYQAHQADYAAKDVRSISQATVQDQATANAIAAKAKAGATIAAAAAPAGANAAVTTLTDQTRTAYAAVAGEQAAAAAFGAGAGTVVGPVRTDFGWAVAKVDAVKTQGGKSLDQARAEIAAKLNVDKRKNAIQDLVDKVQAAADDGHNFVEAVAAAKLPVTTTPLITAAGTSRAQPGFKAPPEYAGVLKTGFEIAPTDPPEIVALPGDQGYAVVSPDQVVAAAPAPLASIVNQIRSDWIGNQALTRARAAATQVAARVAAGTPVAQAIKESGASVPPVQSLAARRIQIANAQGEVPLGLKVMFTLGQGKSRMVPDPQGRGFFIVKVNKIVPGNAIAQPQLIGRMQSEMQQSLGQDYATEFLAAIRKEIGTKRNEAAIEALKKQLVSSGG